MNYPFIHSGVEMHPVFTEYEVDMYDGKEREYTISLGLMDDREEHDEDSSESRAELESIDTIIRKVTGDK